MKKSIKIMLLIFMISLFMMSSFVSADNAYYINQNGFAFSEEDYNLIYDEFGQEGIDAVTEDNFANAIAFARDGEIVISKYFATTYVVDGTGKITETSNREVTEEEYNDSNIQPMANICDDSDGSLGWCIYTDYKELRMNVTASNRQVKVTNTWKKMPTVRSFDVIAVRFREKVSITQATGTQTWSGGSQSYATNGTNTKVGSNGAGISMNLYDGSTTSLKNEMIVRTGGSSADWFNYRINVTYQHAQSSVTLAQSMNYAFATGTGTLGNTIKFNDSTIQAKYDNMIGLQYN